MAEIQNALRLDSLTEAVRVLLLVGKRVHPDEWTTQHVVANGRDFRGEGRLRKSDCCLCLQQNDPRRHARTIR